MNVETAGGRTSGAIEHLHQAIVETLKLPEWAIGNDFSAIRIQGNAIWLTHYFSPNDLKPLIPRALDARIGWARRPDECNINAQLLYGCLALVHSTSSLKDLTYIGDKHSMAQMEDGWKNMKKTKDT